MGKTKIKTIDESAQEPVKKKVNSKDVIPSNEGIQENGSPIESEMTEKAAEGAKKATAPKAKASKASKKVGKAKYRSKKYQEAVKLVDPTVKYPLAEAIKLVKEGSYSKFPSTFEIHINTHVPNIRGLVNMPHATGRSLTVLAFGQDAKDSGADLTGTDETIEEISKGKISFDVIITTPEWMPKLAKVARILGPRGLMPNPKSGTVTDNLVKAVADLKGGKTEYKTEAKGKVIHLSVGKVDQPDEEIIANIKTLYSVVGKSKVKKVTLSPTMGPGVKVNLSSI